MSWGEIREELIERAPGLSLDQANRYIRRAYREILDLRDWSGLHQDGILQTVAAYEAGTIAVTQGSTAIVGTGTAFTAEMTGRRLYVHGSDGEVYTFTYVGPTAATLDRPYESAVNSEAGFIIFQSRYSLPAQVKLVEIMGGGKMPMDRVPVVEFRSAYPMFCDLPMGWAPANDTDESSAPVLHTIDFYPFPMLAVGVPYTYLTAVYEFDGQNTADSPLPWVSVDAIVSGALMRAGVQDGTDYQTFLNRMERVENQRETPRQMQMADRFTEHRRRRLYR